MRYLLTIYADESRWTDATPEDAAALMAAHEAFSREAGDAIRGGEALEPIASATTVRVRNGAPLLTDGPFAETREQLGGFYLVECADLDEAIGLAAKIPDAEYGSVEVRPVMDFEAAGAEAGDQDAAARG